MVKTDIYKQHEAAFAHVQAFVISKNGERVATVAFKFPRDGAGRLYAYVHWIGTEMVRGHATGYGYDKRSAAVESAVAKLERFPDKTAPIPFTHTQNVFIDALKDVGGAYWYDKLEKAGFTVWQAV